MITPEVIETVTRWGAIGWANRELYRDPEGSRAKYKAAGKHRWWRFWRKPSDTEVRRWLVSIGQRALDMGDV